MSSLDINSGAEAQRALHESRRHTLSLILDLDEDQWRVPVLDIVNPFHWEIGHIGWFQERWLLRRDGTPSVHPRGDDFFDSIRVVHDTRWGLPFGSRNEVLEYSERVLEAVDDRLEAPSLSPEALNFARLTLYHEDMHGEALLMTRQTLHYPAPHDRKWASPDELPSSDESGGEVEFAGGRLRLGAGDDVPFAFDNERPSRKVSVAPFKIACRPVSQADYLAFVEDQGYERAELWSPRGWTWRAAEDARCPRDWRRVEGSWQRRTFDQWVPLEDELPVHHVNAFEAEAYCRWAGRRLPSEIEWEFAAGTTRFPWGASPPTPARAQLDLRTRGPVSIHKLPESSTPSGCRHLWGNVWEWTSSVFEPYPGFEPGPYREYSAPWFGEQRVLRGGSFATRARLLRSSWRNFYAPERRDPFVGFRTASDLN